MRTGKKDILGNLDAPIIDTIMQNIMLNAFRIAINGSLTQFGMVDSVVDEFEDESGIDTGASTNEGYDSTNDLYKPTLGAALELDYFEYATDGAAQTAYVTDGDFISNADIDDEDMADISDWTDGDEGSGVSSQVTFDGESCMKLDSGGSTSPTQLANRNQDIGSFGNKTVFSFRTYFDAIGTKANDDHFSFNANNGTYYLVITFASDGLRVYNSVSGHVLIDATIVVQDTWQEWTFVADWTDRTLDIYLDNILKYSNIDFEWSYSTTDGTINFSQFGNTTANRITYIDWFKAGSDGIFDLQCYSESSIKNQGSYSLKVVAKQTDSLNDTLTKSGLSIDLTDKDELKIDVRASRTGTNLRVKIHDSGGTTSTKDINITSADTFQEITWDISGISNANKDNIDQIIFEILNADSETTYYIDNFYALGITNNMTLISNSNTAEAQPDNARIVIFEEDVDSITLNTDLKVYVSRDGGTTWTQATLSDEGDYGTNKQILTGEIDISGQPAGTSMEYKIETLNNKDLKIHGVALSWN